VQKLDTGLQKIFETISKLPSERTTEELIELAGHIKEIQFFKEKEMTDAALLEVVGCMKLMQMDAKETVMQYGDIGDNFYFILSGEVEIRIPDPSRKKKFDALKDEIEVLKDELAGIRRSIDRYKKTKEALEADKAEIEREMEAASSIFSKTKKQEIDRLKKNLEFDIPR
jgi:DNA repair ATPase RecN